MNKVQKGDAFSVKASTWNSFIEAAEWVRNHNSNLSSAASASGCHSGVILLRNGTSNLMPRYAAMVINGVLVNPGSNPDDYPEVPAFIGQIASTSTQDAPFAVTLEPIPAGEIGRAIMLGITPAKVLIGNAAHQYAEPMPDSTSGALQSAEQGTARILWKAGDSGSVSCMLQLGGAGSGVQSSNPVLCCVQNGNAERGFNVSVYGNGKFRECTGYGLLFVTELAMGTNLPSGSWVMGFPTENPVTGGNEP